MATDAGTLTPLCTVPQFTAGPLGDLVRDYPADRLAGVLAEATRQVEDFTDRRLAPFTVTETKRAEGIDPDEYSGGSSGIPVSLAASLGESEALSMGVTNLVRHTWLDQYPPRYQDLWTTSPQLQVTLILSYGGTQTVTTGQILDGPDDTGHIWFQIGTFLPPGSRIRVTYSGGYTLAVPASLVRATKWFAASDVIRELDPDMRPPGRNPDEMLALGEKVLTDGHWVRS